MKISYVSDLHLEFLDFPNFSKEEGGDVLLLAGDILTAAYVHPRRNDENARSLKKYLQKKFKPDLLDKYRAAYMVMGNHEHYRSFFKHTKQTIKDGLNELGLNIKILDNDWVPLDYDTTLIGCTLWSDYFKGNPTSMLNCEYGMNDYRVIGMNEGDYFNKFETNPITAEFLLQEHNKSVQYIREILNRQGNKKTIIMTHHAPTLKSLNSEHCGNGLDGAYASDLSDMILGYPQIAYWICGHCHTTMEYKVGDYSTVLSNCRGYMGEKVYNNFKGLEHFNV